VSPAFAEPSVLLVVQGGIDQDPAPCELRLRSELALEGLEVVTASSQARQSLLDLEGLARRTGAVAGLSVLVDVQSIDGRLWVTDPSSHGDLVRTLHVSRAEADPVSVFALRALEALRGARLELETQRRKLSSATLGSADFTAAAPAAATGASSAQPSAATAAPIVPVPTKTNQKPVASDLPKPRVKVVGSPDAERHLLDSHSWLLQLHGVVGQDLNGVGLVAGPGLAVRRIAYPRLFAGVVVDGPLFSKQTPKAGTVVRVNQELVAAEIRWVPIAVKAISFEVLGTTGISRFAVRGEAQQFSTSRGVSNHTFGWTIGAGLGLGVQLSLTLRLGIDAQWLRRLPAPVVLDETGNKIRRLTGDTDSLLVGRLGLGVLF
jgi:hypothetical protein